MIVTSRIYSSLLFKPFFDQILFNLDGLPQILLLLQTQKWPGFWLDPNPSLIYEFLLYSTRKKSGNDPA